MVWHLYRAIFTDLNTNGYCLIVSRFISQTSSALAPAQLLQSKPLSLNRAAYCLPIKCIDLWPSPLRWGDWEHWDRQEEEMVTWWSQEDGWRFYWNVFHEKRCLWGRENSTIDFGQLFHITQLWLFRKRKELKAIALSLNHCTGFYRKYSLYLFCFIEKKSQIFLFSKACVIQPHPSPLGWTYHPTSVSLMGANPSSQLVTAGERLKPEPVTVEKHEIFNATFRCSDAVSDIKCQQSHAEKADWGGCISPLCVVMLVGSNVAWLVRAQLKRSFLSILIKKLR